MNELDDTLLECLLGILQRGIVESRTCALTGDHVRAAELLDALDNLPRHISNWTDASEDSIASQLATFDELFPDHGTRYAFLLKERIHTL